MFPESSKTVSIEYLDYGKAFQVTISKRHDKIYLDGIFRHTVVQDQDGKDTQRANKSLRLAGKELRIIQPVELGKKFTVSLPDPDEKGSTSFLKIMVERAEGTAVAKALKKSNDLK